MFINSFLLKHPGKQIMSKQARCDKMSEDKLNNLYKERTRLLDAWRNAGAGNKMSILIRIDDIDDQITFIKETKAKDMGDEQPRLHRDS